MELDRHISKTQIVWAVGLLLGLGLAAYIGSAVGNQDIQMVVLILGAFAAIGMGLFLGRDYWMLIPFSIGANFPAVPLGGRSLEFPELAISGCALLYVIRIATRKEKLRVWQAANLPILLFMCWVGIIFALNPIGLAMLGSSVGGGRFYIKLALAFASFLILSSRQYTPRDIKWIFGFIVFGAIFTLVYGIAEYASGSPSINAATGVVQDEYYTWHQLLGVTAFILSFVIFSRWSPRQVFGLQNPFILAVFAVCLVMVIFSGKRLAFAAFFIAPLISALMYRQFKYIFVGAIVALAAMAVVTVGHGQWFQLPLVAQRTVSWLPGDWDPEFDSMRGGTDEWRAELRYLALQNIQKDPIIGRGFAIDMSEVINSISMGERGGGLDIQVAAFAVGRSWHNTWLGYAADFGIPLSVFQALIWLTVLILSAKCFNFYRNSNLLGVFALYVLIYTVRDVVGSHTGGHSALDAFDRWWMYGIVFAIYAQTKFPRARRFKQPFATTLPTPRAIDGTFGRAHLSRFAK